MQETDKTEENNQPPVKAFNNLLSSGKSPIISKIVFSYVVFKKVINKTSKISGVIKDTKKVILSLK